MNCTNILMYHNITSKFNLSFRSISVKLFEKHLNILVNSKLKVLSKGEILDGLFFRDNSTVLLTFDDAYEEVYYSALPLTEKMGLSAIVFVPAAYIGKLNTWDFSPLGSLRHMDKTMLIDALKRGWIVGSHGFSHADLRKCHKRYLMREICDSKKIIEDITGERVDFFAYPFGLYNQRVIDMVAECGYRYAFATAVGRRGNKFAIGRIALYFVDFSPLPPLNKKFCSLYQIRNRTISYFASLTPIYKRILSRIGKIQC